MKWFVKVFYIFNYLVHLNQIRAEIKTQTSKLRENSLALLKTLCLFYVPFLIFCKGKFLNTTHSLVCFMVAYEKKKKCEPTWNIPLISIMLRRCSYGTLSLIQIPCVHLVISTFTFLLIINMVNKILCNSEHKL